MDPVPVAGLTENFSPIPRMAPPPLGTEMEGGVNGPSLCSESPVLEMEADGLPLEPSLS